MNISLRPLQGDPAQGHTRVRLLVLRPAQTRGQELISGFRVFICDSCVAEAAGAMPFLELFPEVIRVLDEVQRRGVPMAVVSDNWKRTPGHDSLGLNGYFATWVVSEELGCCKPDPRMFAAGRDAIAIPAAECLFVDDDPQLVEAAVALGYQGVALGRKRPHAPAEVPWIDSLEGVLDYLPG